ncbi:hypothetical protein C6A37_12930, partial [Desulfobacteraceae bacterium SEEP-SAG9]
MEWGYALKLRDQQEDQSYIMKAGRLVSKHFFAFDRLGMVRLRESPYSRIKSQLDEFLSALLETHKNIPVPKATSQRCP